MSEKSKISQLATGNCKNQSYSERADQGLQEKSY